MYNELNNDNFLLYAAKNYISVHYLEYEFFGDLKRFKYIKRLVAKYKNHNVLKERLILNHIIMLYNVFEVDSCTRMLFLKVNNDHSVLKTFLVYLNFMPDIINNINGDHIYSSDINIDFNIANVLRKL